MKPDHFRDFFELLLYVAVAAVLVYYVPVPFNKFLFLGLLPLAWKSKRDYLWLAFVFVVEDMPGGLFSGGEREDLLRLPVYSLAAGFSFSITELYLLLVLLKVIVLRNYREKYNRPFFSKQLGVIMLLFIYLVIVTPILGAEMDSYRLIAKTAVNLTLFYSIFFLITNKDEFEKFVTALYPFTFVAILLQIYSLAYNQQLIALFKPGVVSAQGIFLTTGSTETLARPIEMVHILFINFTATLFYINKNEKHISTAYLWVVNVLSFVAIFMTATRTWFIGFAVGYLLYLLISNSNSLKMAYRVVAITLFVFLLAMFIPAIGDQITAAWKRIDTIQLIAKGDITAGGTIKRYDQRAPAVTQAFRESTVLLGGAFGVLHHKHQDYHVGYHNLLLNVGILGALIFANLILKLLLVSFGAFDHRKILPVAAIALLMILIMNTGTQYIGFNVLLIPRFFSQAYVLLLLAIAWQMSNEPNTVSQEE